jgi:NADH-quinone oxidoreductase subunit N
MSVGTKAAALIAFARVFDVVLVSLKPDWEPVVWAIAILTIIGGNILALMQSNVKRLLAYSSIAHAGYLLIGVVVGYNIGLSAILYYLFCYTFLNLGAFGIVSMLERADNSGSDYREIRGLWYRQPVLAGLLAFFMLALAGFPPMAGFAAKYYIFYAALQGGHPELLIIGVLASVLGMYYYLRVIATMFMEIRLDQDIRATARVAPTLITENTDKEIATNASAKVFAAVAMKSKTTMAVGEPKSSVSPIEKVRNSSPTDRIEWTSWTALIIAALGTLATGTVLPFWLIGLAQQAAKMIVR